MLSIITLVAPIGALDALGALGALGAIAAVAGRIGTRAVISLAKPILASHLTRIMHSAIRAAPLNISRVKIVMGEAVRSTRPQ